MADKVIKAYKGFNQDLTCRGFQYEVGKEYEMDGNIECCERGFHACESPLEVLDHYFLLDNAKMARFCEVEQSGTIAKKKDSTKVASSKIKIKAELKFADLLRLGIEWIREKTSPKNIKDSDLSDDGDRGKQIGSSGNSAKIGSSGNYAKIDSTGEDSVICCAGHNSAVKAKEGSWITLAEWVRSEVKNRWVPKCVKTEYVDGERIKADTWYELVDGEFVEV